MGKRPILATLIFSIFLLICACLITFGVIQASRVSTVMVIAPFPGVILFLCILVAAPFAYGKADPEARRTRLLRHGIWITWLLITVLFVAFYAELVDPYNSVFDSTDGPEIDRTTDAFFRDRVVPHYGNTLVLTILVGLPAFIYWFRRLKRLTLKPT